MKEIKKEKILIICCIILLFMVGVLYSKNTNLRWQLVYEKSVPDVELVNYLTFGSDGMASGDTTGFVVFNDKEKQSRDLKQYIKITASDNLENGKQLFYLTDILKMNALAPRYFDPVILRIKNETKDIITLADEDNNLYFVNKATKEISIFDGTKDSARLITVDSEYRTFMREFLD